jgi:hypothetical protein
MLGHLEVLPFTHLHTLGASGTKLERESSLEHIADGHVVTVVVPSRHCLGVRLHVPKPVAVLFEGHPAYQAGGSLGLCQLGIAQYAYRLRHDLPSIAVGSVSLSGTGQSTIELRTLSAPGSVHGVEGLGLSELVLARFVT